MKAVSIVYSLILRLLGSCRGVVDAETEVSKILGLLILVFHTR